MCCLSKSCSVLVAAWVGWALAAAFGPVSLAQAQDTVYLRKASGQGQTKREGKIVDWVGDTISIEGKTGVKTLDTGRLIRFETAWHGGYHDGMRLLKSYRYDEAIVQFEAALEGETRRWMQNIICSKLLQCFLAKEDFGKARQYFFLVIDDDPQSRFRHLVPLVWTSSRPNQQQVARAADWMESNDPLVALLGASWLLADKSNPRASEKMERLSRDFDPLVAALAKAQLWRLDRVPPDEKRLAIRIRQVRAMPPEARCGAWYLIAEAQSKTEVVDEAITNFMRIPINDSQQGSLAAAALYQAAWLLDKTDRSLQSQAVRNELKEKFGETVWAN